MKSTISKTLIALGCSIGLVFSGSLAAHASEPVALDASASNMTIDGSDPSFSISTTLSTESIPDLDPIDEASVEELFTKYISLDDRNYMHVNTEEVRASQYAHNIEELQKFAKLMNELNNENLGISFRDGWSFAKCVIADAVEVNMVSRLTNGLYTAIRAAQWPLAAKTILQIAGSAGLSLGWKANAVGLAIALGKSVLYCRGEW